MFYIYYLDVYLLYILVGDLKLKKKLSKIYLPL